MAKSRPDRNSVTRQIERASERVEAFAWPLDVVPRLADADRDARAQGVADRVWACRRDDDWRPSDDVLVAEYATLSVLVADWTGLLLKSGPMIRRDNGQLEANPLAQQVDTASRRRLAIARALAISGAPIDIRTLNSNRPEHRPAVEIGSRGRANGAGALRGLIQ